ncbi:4Fe-4S dicluster domain-containing protein [Magnetospirillum sulfuroxidans]|uniref:4Fe-4S dicluster domain-containing protein n=1 Tax=Magnetospirillum sulfuroxidans TaxID=611300 RepID=A0ABS5I749_9PROT|nr:4Fe-4S dicluster domain-containing protein [Magnetospirillum sulfuroxidans]MBR9970243.1 4Fe-4S dicluster domain-containing protein [Magnetospirillum sulfuroxidans]
MAKAKSNSIATPVLDTSGLDGLIKLLRDKGYQVIGPHRADDAVVYDVIDSIDALPAGWGAEQSPGRYRLRRRDDDALFGYGLAPQGWKRQLYPPRQKIFGASRQNGGFAVDAPPPPSPPMAFIGVRACELAAMGRQAKVFGDRDFADPGYQRRLAEAFVVAVQCNEADSTCFCLAMGSGPEVTTGYDIKLVEVVTKDRHVFITEAGSPRGAKMLKALKTGKASPADLSAAERSLRHAGQQQRRLDAAAARALAANPEHPRWDQLAERCLSCGNCTMVCPTCFCTTIDDVTDLKGDHAERWRKWDSCFTLDFSYIHGGAVRTETRSRYRQWITHKLSTWVDQFDETGCVGCGRCITWCPVGIDITEEAAAITDQGRT